MNSHNLKPKLETMSVAMLPSPALSRRPWLALALMSCLALGSGVAGRAEEPSSANPPLRVGVSPVFPPMAFKQGGELVGVEIDLARALGKKLDRPIVFVEVPWKDQIEALNKQRTDIIMSSMSITMARQYVVNFSQPYFVTGQMALVRREDKIQYTLGFPLTLPGNVGVLKATTGEFLVQQDFPRSKLKSYSNSEDATRALIKKRINLFISDSTLVFYLAGTHADDGLSVVTIPLTQEKLAWAVRKSEDPLLTAVNQFITETQQDGSMRKTFSRWMAVAD